MATFQQRHTLSRDTYQLRSLATLSPRIALTHDPGRYYMLRSAIMNERFVTQRLGLQVQEKEIIQKELSVGLTWRSAIIMAVAHINSHF
ncbi:hypothetical protein OF385_07005 [Glutamicibacter sp. JL.03c]|uniref:hypothetical protein n=1 Tax=Glutamicibacter sp. JL.03c TaxID=2984842 RepID=UPI0021F783AB|nr:hypothetical protein [Glutamicibacter sp. JL.03c]UYQ78879.1 hypothetical protein OF385_07005 [Glutamicibacter sp. JL.03c]